MLVERQEGHLACEKTEWWHTGMCLGEGADLHMAHLMPLPLTLLLQQIQIDFIFLVYLSGADSPR